MTKGTATEAMTSTAFRPAETRGIFKSTPPAETATTSRATPRSPATFFPFSRNSWAKSVANISGIPS